MRLLWLSEYYPFPPQDGNALPIYQFVKRMAQRAEIVLLTARPDEKARIELGGRECLEWARKITAQGGWATHPGLRVAGCGLRPNEEQAGVRLEVVRRKRVSKIGQVMNCLRAGIPWVNRFYSPEFERRARELLALEKFDRVVSEGILS